MLINFSLSHYFGAAIELLVAKQAHIFFLAE